jgi:hypothetical protein
MIILYVTMNMVKENWGYYKKSSVGHISTTKKVDLNVNEFHSTKESH